MDIAELLLMNAVITAACFFVLWRIAVIIRDPSFVDSWWALGMVVIAFASLDITHGPKPHGLILTGLCAAWGVRLGSYLLWRWRKQGPDRRYKTMMGKAEAEKGWSFEVASLRLVFALQAPLLFIVCLPVQLGQRGVDGPLGAVGIAGPILITFLLTRWSGIPTVEGRLRRRRPEYEAYVQRTSSLIPMPPKKA